MTKKTDQVKIVLTNGNGEKKEFIKKTFDIEDNLNAMKHRIKESNFHSKKNATPEEYEEMQLHFVEMITKVFKNEFSAKDLLTLELSKSDILQDVYILALGGTLDDEAKEEQTEKK